MSQEWFKVEVLQDYTGKDEGPSLRAWLNGDKKRGIELLTTDEDPEFTQDCRNKRSQGVELLRVHIVDEILSSYMEWEIEYYKHITIPLRGEQVFIISKSDTVDLNLPKGDLMLFDSKRAVVNSYDQNGRVVRADFYNEHDDLGAFLELKRTLKSRAKPLR